MVLKGSQSDSPILTHRVFVCFGGHGFPIYLDTHTHSHTDKTAICFSMAMNLNGWTALNDDGRKQTPM